MPFGNLGFGEIMLILVVVLLLFGAKRLPEIGSSFGRGIREFKRSISDVNGAMGDGSRDDRTERLRSAEAPPADYRAADSETAAPVARDEEKRPEPKRLLG